MKKLAEGKSGGCGGAGGGGGGELNGQRPPLNPNWAQLQKLLCGATPKPSRRSCSSSSSSSVLGKRKERSKDLESDEPSFPSAASSVLEPTSSDCSLTDVLAMDCEMVGVGTDGTKSALGRVTVVFFGKIYLEIWSLGFVYQEPGSAYSEHLTYEVNAFGNVVYDEFVRPIERIVDFRTSISGIRPRNMRKAKDFCTVQKKVAGLIKGRILVGHALHNDLKVLFLTHPKKDIRDTSEYQPFRRGGKRVALQHLASLILGVKIQIKEHCSVEDARAAMLIYQKYRKNWEKSIKAQLKYVKSNGRNRRKKS